MVSHATPISYLRSRARRFLVSCRVGDCVTRSPREFLILLTYSQHGIPPSARRLTQHNGVCRRTVGLRGARPHLRRDLRLDMQLDWKRGMDPRARVARPAGLAAVLLREWKVHERVVGKTHSAHGLTLPLSTPGGSNHVLPKFLHFRRRGSTTRVPNPRESPLINVSHTLAHASLSIRRTSHPCASHSPLRLTFTLASHVPPSLTGTTCNTTCPFNTHQDLPIRHASRLSHSGPFSWPFDAPLTCVPHPHTCVPRCRVAWVVGNLYIVVVHYCNTFFISLQCEKEAPTRHLCSVGTRQIVAGIEENPHPRWRARVLRGAGAGFLF